jgi:hypothetical protein
MVERVLKTTQHPFGLKEGSSVRLKGTNHKGIVDKIEYDAEKVAWYNGRPAPFKFKSIVANYTKWCTSSELKRI